MTTLDQLRQQYPGWTIRTQPSISATRHRQLVPDETKHFPEAAMNLWAGSLTQLAEMLARQEELMES